MANPDLHAGLQLKPAGRQINHDLLRGRHRPRIHPGRQALRRILAGVVVVSLLAPIGGAIAAPVTPLPDLGDPADIQLSPAQETLLGKAVQQNIRAHLPLVDDTQLNSYIQGLGDRLLANAFAPHIPFTFLIARGSSVNAFAATGGVIVIYAGLIEAAHDEAELAAVMAHEIAHVTQRHMARMLEENQRTSLATLLAVLGGVALGAHAPQAGNAITTGALAGNLQNQLNFSREFEREADSSGIDILARSGYPPEAMASFFSKLARTESPSDAAIPELLRTHPVSSERIAEAEARARNYSAEPPPETITFALAKARLEALLTPPQQIIDAYALSTPAAQANIAMRYRYALALARSGQARQARTMLQALVARNPDSVALRLALAGSTAQAGQPQAALQQLKKLDTLYPRQESIVVELSRLEIQHGAAASALQRLRDLIQTLPVQPATLRLEAEAAAHAGQAAFSHEALARYHFSLGAYTAAIEQIELALRLPGLNAVDEARLRSLRQQMRTQGNR